MKKIEPQDIVPMDMFGSDFPIAVELAYARDQAPNIFGPVYRPNARLWLHRDLASIVLLAAKIVEREHELHLRLYDGLRTVEAQEIMLRSSVVRANPHWLEEPRLLSPPGTGGHPRAMAVDLTLQTPGGALLDMGTVFDHLAENSAAPHNPAHRDHPEQSDEARQNRAILTNAMTQAAARLNTPLLPLPQEWWDFRLPGDISNEYAPLKDADLPEQIGMSAPGAQPPLPQSHFDALKRDLTQQTATALPPR